MRTTLDIADDVLNAVKERARHERRSAGAVLSDLARRSLTAHDSDTSDDDFFGFATLPRRDAIVTQELVDQLVDESGE